jgi:hypothetical protein
MNTPQPNGRSGRTRLVTILAMATVGIAGAVAIGANIGILDAAGASTTGNLSAANDLVPPSTQVVDVYLDSASTSSTTPTTGGVQEFAVDVAGSVSVSTSDQGLRLEAVNPSTGWTWSLAQPGPDQLTVTFTDGVRTLEFVATATSEGNIGASVNEPIVQPSPAPTVGGQHDDDDDGHEEYEGGGDDD